LRIESAALQKSNNGRRLSDMKRKLTPKECMDDLLEYERTQESR